MFSRSLPAGRLRRPAARWLFATWLVCAVLWSGSSQAQLSASEYGLTLPEDSGQWFVGAYYRHAWVPSFMLKPLFERAAGISNDGFGMTVSHSSRHGITTEIGLGYMPYHFAGAFNPNDAAVEDTEYVESTLGLVHLTGSVLWPIQLQRMLSLELGLGIDFGIVTGSLHRTEAYPKDGAFVPCDSALHPNVTGPDTDSQGAAIPYCDQAYDHNGKPADTSGATVSGAHYHDKETRVPPLMLIPMLPHIALRFSPAKRVAIKLEAAFGVAQFWIGASVHLGFGQRRNQLEAQPEPQPQATLAGVPSTAAHPEGRIIGKLMEQGTGRPIAHASVKNKRMFSAIQTDDAGLFVFENLEPGPVHLEITHPDYETGSCDATIGEEGGDTNVHCFLQPGRKEGAISGRVKDQDGKPVPARIEISGPVSVVTQSDASGLFALVDAPEGTYRLRVQSPGYLTQIVEVELGARETALPQIILLRSSEPTAPAGTKPGTKP